MDMTTTRPLIRLEAVDVELSHRPILKGVSLNVFARDYICVVGPNGAGKTTLLRVLAGLVNPTAGVIGLRDGGAARQLTEVGYVADQACLYDTLTTLEHLDFLRSVTRDSREPADVLRSFGLEPLENHFANELSLGQRQRLALAVATFGQPHILVLDEPLNGLDDETRTFVVDHISQHVARGGAVVIATHDQNMLTPNRVLHVRDGVVSE